MSIATLEDAAAICAIQNSIIAKSSGILEERPRTLQEVEVWLTEKLEGNWPVLLAKAEDGEVLGYGTYAPYADGDGYRYTLAPSVHVDEKFRGQGIGSMLMDALIRKASRDAYKVLIVSVDARDNTSQLFHCKHGFAEVGRMPGIATKAGDMIDMVLMQRKL